MKKIEKKSSVQESFLNTADLSSASLVLPQRLGDPVILFRYLRFQTGAHNGQEDQGGVRLSEERIP